MSDLTARFDMYFYKNGVAISPTYSDKSREINSDFILIIGYLVRCLYEIESKYDQQTASQHAFVLGNIANSPNIIFADDITSSYNGEFTLIKYPKTTSNKVIEFQFQSINDILKFNLNFRGFSIFSNKKLAYLMSLFPLLQYYFTKYKNDYSCYSALQLGILRCKNYYELGLITKSNSLINVVFEILEPVFVRIDKNISSKFYDIRGS